MVPKEWWEHEYDTAYVSKYRMRNIDIQLHYTVMDRRYASHSSEEMRLAVPIAEVLCLLKREPISNYEKYMETACELMDLTPNRKELSWVRDTHHENASVYEAWAQWRMMKALSSG